MQNRTSLAGLLARYRPSLRTPSSDVGIKGIDHNLVPPGWPSRTEGGDGAMPVENVFTTMRLIGQARPRTGRGLRGSAGRIAGRSSSAPSMSTT